MDASHTAAPLFGADRERMAGVLERVEERAGRRQLAAWVETGRRLRDDEIVAFARAAAGGIESPKAAPSSYR